MVKKIRQIWVMCLAILPFVSFTVQAALEGKTVIGAGVSDGDLFIYTTSEVLPITQDGLGNFQHVALHGNKLAFTRTDADLQQNLWLSIDGESPFILVSNVDAFYPFSFTDDGLILFAKEHITTTDSTSISDVYTIAPEVGAEPKYIAQINDSLGVLPGCGGGSPLPTDWQYWNEAGFGGRRGNLLLTSFGIIYTLDCHERTILLNLETNDAVEIGHDFANAILSPDGIQLAGITIDSTQPELGNQLAVANLTSGKVSTYETAMPVDQVTWSITGDSIFYITNVTLQRPIPMTDAEQQALNRYFGAGDGAFTGFPLYVVQIRRFDLATHIDIGLYSAPEDVASIGRVFALDEDTLIFSQIPNLQRWIADITAEIFDPAAQGDTTTAQIATVPVKVLKLTLSTSELAEIGSNINGFIPGVPS